MKFAAAHFRPRRRQLGLTLVELLVVLGVLIVVAGIVTPLLTNLKIGAELDGTGGKSPQQIATEQTLLKVRDAILGTPGQKGYWTDLGERDSNLPQTLADLLSADAPSGVPAFVQNTRLGWRGPYLQSTGARLDPDHTFDPDDFYGNDDDPAVLDGWGTPIVLQFPADPDPEVRARFVRLVSAGPGLPGIKPRLDTPRSDLLPSRADCQDDILLFLRVPDTRP